MLVVFAIFGTVVLLSALAGWFSDTYARSAHPGLVKAVAWLAILTTAVLCVAASWAWRTRKRTKQHHLMELLVLTPTQFEEAIGRLLTDLGYRGVRRVGRAGDLAADLIALDREGRRTVVQCKRLAPGSRVGSPDVQTFIGMLTVHHRAEQGIFVTTAEFTEPAENLAKQHDIALIDGSRLCELLIRIHKRSFGVWSLRNLAGTAFHERTLLDSAATETSDAEIPQNPPYPT
jgi:HJR/Mrr/RecB family endonuclease